MNSFFTAHANPLPTTARQWNVMPTWIGRARSANASFTGRRENAALVGRRFLPASLKPQGYGREMLLLLTNDTAPLRAKALPSRVALELRLMLVSASMLPFIALPVPSEAELPTCQ